MELTLRAAILLFAITFWVAVHGCGPSPCAHSTSLEQVKAVFESEASSGGNETPFAFVVSTGETVLIAAPYALTEKSLASSLPNLSGAGQSELIDASNARELVLIAVIGDACVGEIGWLDDRYRVGDDSAAVLLIQPDDRVVIQAHGDSEYLSIRVQE